MVSVASIKRWLIATIVLYTMWLSMSIAAVVNEIWINDTVNSSLKSTLYLEFPLNLFMIPFIVIMLIDYYQEINPERWSVIPASVLVYPVLIFMTTAVITAINSEVTNKSIAKSISDRMFINIYAIRDVIMIFLLTDVIILFEKIKNNRRRQNEVAVGESTPLTTV